MSEFETFFWGVFSIGIVITFVVMLIRRPGEKSRETFDKRDW